MREGQIYEAALQGDEAALANFLKAIRAINSDKKEAVIGIQERENERGEPAVAFQFQRELLYVCDEDVDSIGYFVEKLPYPLLNFEQSVASIFSADIGNVSVHAMGVFCPRVGAGIRILKYTDLAHMPITLQIIVPVQELLILDGADRFYQLLQSAAVLSYSSRPGLPSASMRQTHNPLSWLARVASACVPRPLADSGCIPACTRDIARTKPVGFDIADFQIDSPYVHSSLLIGLLSLLHCLAVRLPLGLLYIVSYGCCNDCSSNKVAVLREQLCVEDKTAQRYQRNGEVDDLTTVAYGCRCFFACRAQLFSNNAEGERALMLPDQRDEQPNYGAFDEEPGGPPRQRMWDIEGRISPGAGPR